MIKIKRISAPVELTPQVVADKTTKFKADSTKTVWKEDYILKRLMEMSHGKCCYCECELGEESKYMEVEHFHPKKEYPNEVVVWDNLLPSCRSCNGNKGSHDTVASPIVNPTVDEPKDHLAFRLQFYWYEQKTNLGDETIELLDLNNNENRVLKRFRICLALSKKVKDYLEEVRTETLLLSTKKKNQMKNKVRELLEACQCDREYTAIKATILVHNPDYSSLITEMKTLGLWTQDLIDLDNNMRLFVLDVV